MGRLRNFGKSSKRPSSADASALAIQEGGKDGDGTKAAAEGNSDEPEVLSEHAVRSISLALGSGFLTKGCRNT